MTKLIAVALTLEHVHRGPSLCGVAQCVAVALPGVDAGSPWWPTGGTATPRGEHFTSKQSDCWGEGNAPMTKLKENGMKWLSGSEVNILQRKREKRRRRARNSHLQNMGRENRGMILETLRVSAAVVGLFLCLLFSIYLYFPNNMYRKSFYCPWSRGRIFLPLLAFLLLGVFHTKI